MLPHCCRCPVLPPTNKTRRAPFRFATTTMVPMVPALTIAGAERGEVEGGRNPLLRAR